jgi:hypothetical protein
MFPDVMAACKAASVLRDNTSVDAVEMFDRASLRECESNEDMARLVPDIKGEPPSWVVYEGVKFDARLCWSSQFASRPGRLVEHEQPGRTCLVSWHLHSLCWLSALAAGADPMAAALLIECRGQTSDDLEARIQEVHAALHMSGLPFGAKSAEPQALEVSRAPLAGSLGHT